MKDEDEDGMMKMVIIIIMIQMMIMLPKKDVHQEVQEEDQHQRSDYESIHKKGWGSKKE